MKLVSAVRVIGDVHSGPAIKNFNQSGGERCGPGKKIIKPIWNQAKKFVVDSLKGAPSKDTIIVVLDAKAAETAAGNIVLYLDERGQKVCLMEADTYHKLRYELVNNRVIIIGHHDLVREQLGNVNVQDSDPMCSEYGLICGTSYKKCVLRASRKALSRKKQGKRAFALYYQDKMSGYAAFAEKYGVPREYGKRGETRESQYDLLWTIFVNEVLPSLGWEREPAFGGGTEQERAQGAGPESHPGQPGDGSEKLLEQFLREAPFAPCVTPDYLRQFYERQLKFTVPSLAQGEGGEDPAGAGEMADLTGPDLRLVPRSGVRRQLLCLRDGGADSLANPERYPFPGPDRAIERGRQAGQWDRVLRRRGQRSLPAGSLEVVGGARRNGAVHRYFRSPGGRHERPSLCRGRLPAGGECLA